MTEKKITSADEWGKLKHSNGAPDDKKKSFNISPELRETIKQVASKQTKDMLEHIAPQIEQIQQQMHRDMLPIATLAHCIKLKWQYKKLNNDSLYAIEAFLLCHNRGIEPPVWAMSCLAEKFGEFCKSEGTKSLDRLFGFGRSKGKRFKKRALEKRNYELCFDVFKLIILFGISPEEASDMAASKHNLFNPNHNLNDLTVLGLYRKEWKGFLEVGDNELMQKELMAIPTKERIDYLKTFSEGPIPTHLAHFFDK